MQSIEARAERNIERAASLGVSLAGDLEALHGPAVDAQAFAGREAVDSRNVAVGHEAAEFVLHAIEQVERRPGGLLGIVTVAVDAEDLELGVHGLVGEAARADAGRVDHRSSSHSDFAT